MATVVFLHAHPDDEASSTGGTIAQAVQQGHRVVTVFATNGEHGEVPDDLRAGETIVDRRRAEAAAAAKVLGTHRVEWLGYADSGMTGWEGNSQADSFHMADIEEAATRLAHLLDDEDADVLVTYDWHGNYGHPDHVKVHPVAYRAATLAKRRPRVLEVSMNRDALREARNRALAAGQEMGFDPDGAADDGNGLGTPAAQLHYCVDVSRQLDLKRRALLSHASQTTDVAALTGLDDQTFQAMMGQEYYHEHGIPNGMVNGMPF